MSKIGSGFGIGRDIAVVSFLRGDRSGDTQSFLRRPEQRLVAWLLPRIPASVTPRFLTILGFCGAILAAIGLVACRWNVWGSIAIAIGISLNWFGNLFDGPLAFYRRQENPRLTYIIDHTADLFSLVIIIVSFGLSPFLSLASSLTVLLCFLLFSSYAYIKAVARHTRQSSYLGIGASEFRLLMIVWACGGAVLGVREPLVKGFSRVDAVIIGLAAIAVIGLAYRATRDALQVNADERARMDQAARTDPAVAQKSAD
jgi:hypothetical protein